MTVATILKRKGSRVVTVRPDTTVAAIAETLVRERIGAAVVADSEGGIAGIVSERDIVVGLARRGAAVLEERAETIMTKKVVTCTPEQRVDELMATMTEGRFRHLPVVAQGRLAGIVSIGDVVKSRLEALEAEAGALRSYIASG